MPNSRQQHADVGDELDPLGRLLAERMEHEPGGEVADQGRQAARVAANPKTNATSTSVRSIVRRPSVAQSARVPAYTCQARALLATRLSTRWTVLHLGLHRNGEVIAQRQNGDGLDQVCGADSDVPASQRGELRVMDMADDANPVLSPVRSSGLSTR